MPKTLNEVLTYDAEGKVIQSVVSVAPKAESSVEITTNSKGESQLTVKCYHEDLKIALSLSLAMYEEGLLQLDMMKAKRDGVISKIKQIKEKKDVE